MLFRCPRCVSVGLVCLCLAQGVKAPPAQAVGAIVSQPVVGTSTAPSGGVIAVVDCVTGTRHSVAPQRLAFTFSAYSGSS
jgi:hypothetical protein